MRYTVIWGRVALGRLAGLWLWAPDRDAVTAASHQIDQLLRIDPDTRGSPLFGDRVLRVPPLTVRFSINPMDMMVEVHDVW
ncbi:MAG: hypothetical protein K2P78_02320 [Gemmataceae bacterium]|nr:hypothetical protein [Gemmataceae bacterium]